MRNPLFPNREVSARRKFLIWLTLSIAALIGFGIFIIYGPLLRISGVVVQGLSSIPTDQVVNTVNQQLSARRWFIFPQNNRLLFDKETLAQNLIGQFSFKNVVISQDGKILVVHTEESVLEVALKVADKTYFLTLEGIVSREASTDEISKLAELHPNMPIIVVGQLEVGEQPGLAERMVSGVIAAHEGLRLLDLKPESYEIMRSTDRWFTAKMQTGFDVLIDATKDINDQLATLKTILDNREGTTYEYIDVRFGEHVFVKEL